MDYQTIKFEQRKYRKDKKKREKSKFKNLYSEGNTPKPTQKNKYKRTKQSFRDYIN